MKLKTAELKDKLSLIRSEITKSNIAALECAAIIGGKMIGSNDVLSISIDFNCDMDVLLPQKAIDVILKCNNEYIDISVIEPEIVIKQGRSTLKFAMLNPADYPQPPKCSHKGGKQLTCDTVKQISSVTYACTTDDIKPILQGVLIDDENIVACDGYRIAINKNGNGINEVINARCIKLLSKINKNMTVTADDSRLYFYADGVEIATKQILGNYLEYKKAIPQEQTEIKMSLAETLNALETISIISEPKSPLKLSITEDNICISSNSPTCQYSDNISISGGKVLEIGVNAKFFYDAVKSMPCDFTMKVSDSTSGIVLEAGEQMAMVLPVRFK